MPLPDIASRPGILLGLNDSPLSRLCLKGTDTTSDRMSLTLITTRVEDMGSEAVSVPSQTSLRPGNFPGLQAMSEKGSAETREPGPSHVPHLKGGIKKRSLDIIQGPPPPPYHHKMVIYNGRDFIGISIKSTSISIKFILLASFSFFY